MHPWFIATERFGPWDGQAWIKYVKWSGLEQLEELVSLDSTLCDTVLPNIKGEYWPYIVNEDYMGHFFVVSILPYKYQDDRDHFIEGMRKAGLPE